MKKAIIAYVALLFLTLSFTLGLNAFFAGNMSQCAFVENCANGEIVSGSSSLSITSNDAETLGYLVAEGGSYFLKGNAGILQFLSQVEASEVMGFDFITIRQTLEEAISDMEKAHAVYDKLKDLAENTPYNQAVIDRLTHFDYTDLQKEKGLLPSIFGDVVYYLSSGDVRGVYKQFYKNTGDILERMQVLKKAVDENIAPDLDLQWQLNQKIAEYKLFGQYVAEVFYKIE